MAAHSDDKGGRTMSTLAADLNPLAAHNPSHNPSIDEWVVGLLQKKGAQTLDQLAGSLPEVNWAQLFLAVDRLSRSGKVLLCHGQRGDYIISLKEADVAGSLLST
jgi:hypothetical protein